MSLKKVPVLKRRSSLGGFHDASSFQRLRVGHLMLCNVQLLLAIDLCAHIKKEKRIGSLSGLCCSVLFVYNNKLHFVTEPVVSVGDK